MPSHGASGRSQDWTAVPVHASPRLQQCEPRLIAVHTHMACPGKAELCKDMHPLQLYCTWHGDQARISMYLCPDQEQSTTRAM